MKVSVTVPPELAKLIEAKLQTGRYRSVGEVICAGLRMLDQAERLDAEEIERLRRAWNEGVESGDAGPLDFAALRSVAVRSGTLLTSTR